MIAKAVTPEDDPPAARSVGAARTLDAHVEEMLRPLLEADARTWRVLDWDCEQGLVLCAEHGGFARP